MHIHPTQSIMFNWCSFHSYCLSLPSLILQPSDLCLFLCHILNLFCKDKKIPVL